MRQGGYCIPWLHISIWVWSIGTVCFPQGLTTASYLTDGISSTLSFLLTARVRSCAGLQHAYMEKKFLNPNVWKIIRQFPKVSLTEQQNIYLSEVYDLSNASESIKELLMNNNCVAVDNAGNNYLFCGNINAFINMLIYDLKREQNKE